MLVSFKMRRNLSYILKNISQKEKWIMGFLMLTIDYEIGVIEYIV